MLTRSENNQAWSTDNLNCIFLEVVQLLHVFTIFSLFSPQLTWRDVQHIIVHTAQLTSPVDEGWMQNGAGFHFNHKFGFGRLDAGKMVEAAKRWVNVPPQRKCTGAFSMVERYSSSLNFLF